MSVRIPHCISRFQGHRGHAEVKGRGKKRSLDILASLGQDKSVPTPLIEVHVYFCIFVFHGSFLYSSHTKFSQFPTEPCKHSPPFQNNASVFSRYRGHIFCHGLFYNTIPNAIEVDEHSWIFIKAVKTWRNKCPVFL